MWSLLQRYRRGLTAGGLSHQDVAVMVASPLLVLVTMGLLVKIIQVNVIGIFEPYKFNLPPQSPDQFLVIEKTPWYDEEAILRSYKAKAIF